MAEQKAKAYRARMDEGRKRVLSIIARILVARHLKTTEDLFDTRDSPRTRSMVAAAVQWAERIMQKSGREGLNPENPIHQQKSAHDRDLSKLTGSFLTQKDHIQKEHCVPHGRRISYLAIWGVK